MATTMRDLGIDRMNAEDRLKLVEGIWDSLATEAEQEPITDSQRKDLERRLDAYDANPKAGSSWEEVKARLVERPL